MPRGKGHLREVPRGKVVAVGLVLTFVGLLLSALALGFLVSPSGDAFGWIVLGMALSSLWNGSRRLFASGVARERVLPRPLRYVAVSLLIAPSLVGLFVQPSYSPRQLVLLTLFIGIAILSMNGSSRSPTKLGPVLFIVFFFAAHNGGIHSAAGTFVSFLQIERDRRRVADACSDSLPGLIEKEQLAGIQTALEESLQYPLTTLLHRPTNLFATIFPKRMVATSLLVGIGAHWNVIHQKSGIVLSPFLQLVILGYSLFFVLAVLRPRLSHADDEPGGLRLR